MTKSMHITALGDVFVGTSSQMVSEQRGACRMWPLADGVYDVNERRVDKLHKGREQCHERGVAKRIEVPPYSCGPSTCQFRCDNAPVINQVDRSVSGLLPLLAHVWTDRAPTSTQASWH